MSFLVSYRGKREKRFIGVLQECCRCKKVRNQASSDNRTVLSGDTYSIRCRQALSKRRRYWYTTIWHMQRKTNLSAEHVKAGWLRIMTIHFPVAMTMWGTGHCHCCRIRERERKKKLVTRFVGSKKPMSVSVCLLLQRNRIVSQLLEGTEQNRVNKAFQCPWESESKTCDGLCSRMREKVWTLIWVNEREKNVSWNMLHNSIVEMDKNNEVFIGKSQSVSQSLWKECFSLYPFNRNVLDHNISLKFQQECDGESYYHLLFLLITEVFRRFLWHIMCENMHEQPKIDVLLRKKGYWKVSKNKLSHFFKTERLFFQFWVWFNVFCSFSYTRQQDAWIVLETKCTEVSARLEWDSDPKKTQHRHPLCSEPFDEHGATFDQLTLWAQIVSLFLSHNTIKVEDGELYVGFICGDFPAFRTLSGSDALPRPETEKRCHFLSVFSRRRGINTTFRRRTILLPLQLTATAAKWPKQRMILQQSSLGNNTCPSSLF